MENKKKKSTGLLLSILGVISLVLITAGVTYAFFSYAKQGEKENTITTGSITFIYNETGTALNIQDALPKADSVGMADTDTFQFTVTSTTPSTAYINYIVTAKKAATSTLPEDQVKLYLQTANTGDGNNGAFASTIGVKTGTTAGSILTYNNLPDADDSAYSTIFAGTLTAPADEKVIYAGQVPTNQKSTANPDGTYVRTFNLRMWLMGAEERCFIGASTTPDTSITTKEACEAATPTAGVWRADTTGMKDYSAYEFVLKSAIDTASATQYTVVDTESTDSTTAAGQLLKGTEILTSVDYYAALEAGTIQAANYTRLAAVNQTERKVYTVAQPSASIPSGTNWEASEQFYPFNGGTFKVTLNVYAEGATTYTVTP